MYDFLEPINIASLSNDKGYSNEQYGNHISAYEDEIPDLAAADIVIAGVNEYRGEGINIKGQAAEAIRSELYQLHFWHSDIKIADIGNIKTGATIADSYSAIKTILIELLNMNKTVVLLGGSHDIMLAQYYAFKQLGRQAEATVIDSKIDLTGSSSLPSENFLMEMLTTEPNFIKHYNHIGFQSYLVHPHMLETMHKLRFDCYRVAVAKENIEEM